MTEYINEGMASQEEVAEYIKIDNFTLELKVTYNEDGTYKMYADADAAKAAFDGVKADFTEGMRKYFEDYIESSKINMTVDEVLSLSGTTIEAVVEEALSDDVLNEMVSEMSAEGKYKAQDGKLYMLEVLEYNIDEDEYETYEVSGDEFKLLASVSADGNEDDLSALYPMTFKRIK